MHNFYLVNFPYYSEHVKKISIQIFTAAMGNQYEKGTPFFAFFHFTTSLMKYIPKTFWCIAVKYL